MTLKENVLRMLINKLLEKKTFKSFLIPLKPIYWLLILIRNKLYDSKIFNIYSLEKTVISIGNLTIGGTGKTPFTIFIAKYFIKHGIKVAILSRGYGRKSKGTIIVSNGINLINTHEKSGDEPYLIAKKLKNVPVIVDEKRYRGGKFIINNYNPDVIILDDGYQHRSLKRDFNILLINSLDKKTDHKLIPNGKLREPWKNIKRADIIIKTKSNLIDKNTYLNKKIKQTNITTFISESHISISEKFTKKSNRNINLSKRNVLIITAIGDQASFIKSIKKLNCNIIKKINFKDHYNFKQKVWTKIENLARNLEIDFILTTEKDWIKINYLATNIPIVVFELNINLIKPEKFYKVLNNLYLGHSPSKDNTNKS